METRGQRIILLAGLVLLSLCLGTAAGDPPLTGPATEKRFPPLKVPEGFKATLFACDPLIEYPSAVALGPRPGSLFVAADYMTGLGTEIIRRDEIRLLEDTDGDGYADKSTVYADGFNSIEGLTYHSGAVYAMHAPFLTALRDMDGDGKADERRDIVNGLGLTPEQNPVRLHCANGLVMGHDGWLYLALGDHGADVARPEGDRLVLEGGGILRVWPDGRDLHVFATGLRNIYDVALDAELNVFVRDNENDGGDYKIRVCHSFAGADHGYPYLYYERPGEALTPLADLGLGSSAGGLCYLERQFPAEFRGNLLFCEWGRSVVRYPLQRADNGGFAPIKEIEFAAGAENDPYGFKPTDVVVERDGSLIVADWADGQRPNRGRARIYRIQHGGPTPAPPANGGREAPGKVNRTLSALITQLDSESYYERIEAQEAISARGPEGRQALLEAIDQRRVDVRGRLHAIWILARSDDPLMREKLFELAGSDPDPHVRSQAVRALADVLDPILTRHRLDAGPGDPQMAARLAGLAKGGESGLLLEIIVAIGRLRWPDAPQWLRETLSAATASGKTLHPALEHAAMQTFRRSGNWPAVLQLLDLPVSDPVRSIALRAIADQAVPEVADALIARLALDPTPNPKEDEAVRAQRRREYADALTRIYKKPSRWVYWGYRPAPRPANTVAWERTAAIEGALDHVLADPDRTLRLASLRRMQRENVPAKPPTLMQWLATEREPGAVSALLDSLREQPANDIRDTLQTTIIERGHAPANRLAALALFVGGLDEASAARLLHLAARIEDGPVAAELLRQLGHRPQIDAALVLFGKLTSTSPEVRTAAIDALAELRVPEAGESVRKLLDDKDPSVRRAAVAAVGRLAVRSSVEQLLALAKDSDAPVRRASLDSLRRLGESRVVPLAVAALADRETQRTALECIGELGSAEQAPAVIDLANRDQSAEVVNSAIGLLTKWANSGEKQAPGRLALERAVAELQGQSGMLVRWSAHGPLLESAVPSLVERLTADREAAADSVNSPETRSLLATGLEGRVTLAEKVQSAPEASADRVWVASTDLFVPEAAPVQFFAAGTGKFQVWLNGRRIFARDEPRAFQADADRFDGTLEKGPNRVVVQTAATRERAEFHVRFRRKTATAELEQLAQAALARAGDAERGRKLFFDAAKIQCSKCHRISEQGERIGPELTGIGERFSRIHIVESILEPSRTVTPGYQTIALALTDGRVLTGIKVAETETTLTLGDNQGQKHILAKSEIEEQKPQALSTMPDGLVKQLTVDQFVDLIAFLTSQKQKK